MLSLLLSALVVSRAVAVEKISDAKDLIYFADRVNRKHYYEGETVYLENDIVFTEELSRSFLPIGKDYLHAFQGTFDGRGHKISGLIINATTEYAGLFGNCENCVIKNVVIDKSCKMDLPGAEKGTVTRIGGIAGQLYAKKNPFFVESCVNMMNIAYKNRADSSIAMGGIGGGIFSYLDNCFIVNCINIGQLSFRKEGELTSITMGGILGGSGVMFQEGFAYVRDCINYGDIKYNGPEIIFTYFGGIVADDGWCEMKNCTNYGTIYEN